MHDRKRETETEIERKRKREREFLIHRLHSHSKHPRKRLTHALNVLGKREDR